MTKRPLFVYPNFLNRPGPPPAPCGTSVTPILKEIGFDAPGPHWTVTTQFRLAGNERGFDRKQPDIRLLSHDQRREAIIEVKVNAGVTYGADRDGVPVPQLDYYREYLDDQRTNGRIDAWKLATLTRWSPTPEMLGDGVVSIRFSHLAVWLEDTAGELADKHLGWLAREWATYLWTRRWAMRPIEQRHVNAIDAMAELQTYLWDVVMSMADDATKGGDDATKGGKWRVRGRSSSSVSVDNSYIAGAPMVPAGRDGESPHARITCWFGVAEGKPFITLGVHVGEIPAELDLQSPFQDLPIEPMPAWRGLRIHGLDVAREIQEGREPWDHARASVALILERVHKVLLADS